MFSSGVVQCTAYAAAVWERSMTLSRAFRERRIARGKMEEERRINTDTHQEEGESHRVGKGAESKDKCYK